MHPDTGRDPALALQGRDVAGQAQTGTGKTAAFLIAVYHHLMIHPGRRATPVESAACPDTGTDP